MVWFVSAKQLKGDDGQGTGKYHLVAESDAGGGFHVLSQVDHDSEEAARYDPAARLREQEVTGMPCLLFHRSEAQPFPEEWRSLEMFGNTALHHIDVEPSVLNGMVRERRSPLIIQEEKLGGRAFVCGAYGFFWADGRAVVRQVKRLSKPEGLENGLILIEF